MYKISQTVGCVCVCVHHINRSGPNLMWHETGNPLLPNIFFNLVEVQDLKKNREIKKGFGILS